MLKLTRRTHLSVLIAAAGLVLAAAPDAQATHFRYGQLQWQPTGAVTGEVKFTLRMALRRDTFAYGTFPNGIDQFAETGDIITEGQGNTRLSFGDGGVTAVLRFIVTDFSVTENWLFVEALNPGSNATGVLHVYPGTGPYQAMLSNGANSPGCCRLSSPFLNNRADGAYPIQTVVRPRDGNSSPSSSLVPVVVAPRSSAATFLVPAADPDGDGVRFRMSTDAEAGGPSHPPGISINNFTGQVTWNNIGLNDTRFWTAQVVIEDLGPGGVVKTKTPVDFLLKIVPNSGNPPSCAVTPPGPVTVPPGTPVTFTVTGTDPDAGQQLILSSSGVPVGATMTPPLPFSSLPPVISTFNWTPTNAQTGAHVISYSVTDPAGQQALCSKTINVIANTPPTVTCPAPATVHCTGPGGATHTLTAHVKDADGDALIVTWRVNGTVVKTETVPSGGGTTSANVTLTHLFPLGTNTVQVSVDDGEASVVSCQTTVTVVDHTAPTVTCTVQQGLLWPPNHNMINVGLLATASDTCQTTTSTVVSVFGDEDDEEPTGDGRFSPDALHIASSTLELRAERRGNADGRVYLIRARASDGTNQGWACCTVVVPQGMSPKDQAAVLLQAATAQAICQTTGAAPAGYFVIGDGGVIGPKQEPRAPVAPTGARRRR